ncbi:FCD domain-containing protein [Clostridiaceae bacterium HSG29]|nr:FCD domain-containing protein [Clostridiaceae bacterium HSG29]
MKQILDEFELKTLKIINELEEPIGSWALENKLKDENIIVSTATIGRLLAKLENNKYLEKQNNKGRVITFEGKVAIKKAETIERINQHKENLENIVLSELLENYVMIIQARKAIEKETCRLAARFITKDELIALDEIIKKQEILLKEGKSIAEEDILFHETIAKASRNVILESMYSMISTFKQQSTMFEHLRKHINSPYNYYHRKIYEAIKNGDEEEASKAMEGHLENLINDVLTYWSSYNNENTDK